jgi:hypothetical protein
MIMKKLFLLVVTGLLFAGMSFAQGVRDMGSGDANSGKSRGEDPNIKMEKRLNSADVETQAVQSADKGAKVRAPWCDAAFSNWTDWYIDCYVDGYYEGYVAPWGDGTVTVGSGTTSMYAVAEFDDGSRVSWGPVSRECEYQTFKLSLYEDSYVWDLYY